MSVKTPILVWKRTIPHLRWTAQRPVLAWKRTIPHLRFRGDG